MNDDSRIQEIQKNLDKYTYLDVLARTEGGKLLIAGLTEDIKTSMERLSLSYKSLTHPEMISICAAMGANLDLLHTLTRSEKNKDLAKEALEAALKE